MREQTLPTRPRLRPGLSVLHRRTGEIQIGLDPRRAVVVSELPEPVVSATAGLSGGRTTDELLTVVGPDHRSEMRQLLVGLAEQGLVEDAAAAAAPVPLRLAGDRTAATRRAFSAADRAAAAVKVHGDGRLAAAIACHLAAAGVGRVHVAARGAVTPEDVGAGLLVTDVGRPRAEAAHDAVHRVDEAVGTRRFTRRRPDLVVLTDAVVPDPGVVSTLEEDGTPHLCVRVREGVGIVGPFVLPGVSSCLRCADHHRTDRDPCWPRVAAQLAGVPQLCDLATLHTTAGLATAQVLDALAWLRRPDSLRPVGWNTSVEVNPHTADIDHRPWDPHPACRCRAATNPAYRRPRR